MHFLLLQSEQFCRFLQLQRATVCCEAKGSCIHFISNKFQQELKMDLQITVQLVFCRYQSWSICDPFSHRKPLRQVSCQKGPGALCWNSGMYFPERSHYNTQTQKEQLLWVIKRADLHLYQCYNSWTPHPFNCCFCKLHLNWNLYSWRDQRKPNTVQALLSTQTSTWKLKRTLHDSLQGANSQPVMQALVY